MQRTNQQIQAYYNKYNTHWDNILIISLKDAIILTKDGGANH